MKSLSSAGFLGLIASIVLGIPATADAQSVSQLVGYLNVLVGVMIVMAFLCFVGGFAVYIGRIGLPGRDWGLTVMSWGVSILFVLVLMLTLVKFAQEHLQLTLTIVALVVFLFAGKFVLDAIAASSAGEEKDH
jgi:hypothetical protein